MSKTVVEIAEGLSERQRTAVMNARKMASGGVRVSFHTSSETWAELENAGLLTTRTTACLVSSYLSDLGRQVAAHLKGTDHGN